MATSDDSILKIFSLLEVEAEELEFGVITTSVVIKNGVPQIDTLTLVKSLKKKYAIVKGKKNGK